MKFRFFKIFIFISFFLFFVLLLNSFYISSFSQDFVYDHIENIPKNKVGLVLGTSPRTIWGLKNTYFSNRIKAAYDLYISGKVDFLIVSGDNSDLSYNEPKYMRQSLVDMGIPEDKIKEDYAGFRTLDSVVRAKEVFGQSSITIISQKFHNERAIFLAKNKGIDAIAYNAKEENQLNFLSVKNHFREYFARVNAVLDLLIDTRPKFLGPLIEVK